MSDLGLYLAAVLIWGSTWLVITFQLGVVPPAVSVVWRFGLAAVLLLGFSAACGRSLRFSGQQHLWIALQGVLLFGMNYLGIYLAEQSLTSGLVAVVFSLVVIFNTLGMRVFFSRPIHALILLAALIGISGVALVFWPQMRGLHNSLTELQGLALAVGATVMASFGNMVAVRNHRHAMPVLQVNAWSMLYGAAFIAVVALAFGLPFTFDWRWPYVASLLYLALFGSALAFGAYLTLMARIGADRASYVAVAIPVVALLVSTLFEHLRWQLPTVAGVALCVASNVLVLRGAWPSGTL